jgi:hypothetical protein
VCEDEIKRGKGALVLLSPFGQVCVGQTREGKYLFYDTTNGLTTLRRLLLILLSRLLFILAFEIVM